MNRCRGNLVFFDIETAGGHPNRHPIIQIAAIAVDESLEMLEAYEAKIWFDRRKADRRTIHKSAYRPGLWVGEAKNPKDVARGFGNFLRRHASVDTVSSRGERFRVAQLVAHNAAFDGPFLQAWYSKLHAYLPAHRLVFCTMHRAMWHFAEHPHLPPPANFKLATLCRHLGVPFHAADAHEALGDTLAMLRLYRALHDTQYANGRANDRHPPPSMPVRWCDDPLELLTRSKFIKQL